MDIAMTVITAALCVAMLITVFAADKGEHAAPPCRPARRTKNRGERRAGETEQVLRAIDEYRK